MEEPLSPGQLRVSGLALDVGEALPAPAPARGWALAGTNGVCPARLRLLFGGARSSFSHSRRSRRANSLDPDGTARCFRRPARCRADDRGRDALRTAHNFLGRPVPGYRENTCILSRQAAEALARVQERATAADLTLKVYDCYRPQRSVDAFVAWAKDLDDTRMKAEFYPRVRKNRLFEDGYIAEQSGHSRGSTVDLTLVRTPPRRQETYTRGDRLRRCARKAGIRFRDNSLDMGTGYDCFDPLSHTYTGTSRASSEPTACCSASP